MMHMLDPYKLKKGHMTWKKNVKGGHVTWRKNVKGGETKSDSSYINVWN